MLTFRGYWLESITPINRELVARNEEPASVDGSVPIRYDIVNKLRFEHKNGVTIEKYTAVIKVDTKVTVKKSDMIWTDKWLKVEKVDEIIQEDKKHTIRMFPNSASRFTDKIVYLV